MRIQAYSFGNIKIDGNSYSKDVIIFPDRILSPWWRKEGHLLQVPDVEEVVKAGVKTLVIGTGYSGLMRVLEETFDYLESKGITVYIEKSEEAVRVFNEISGKQDTAGAFHLTC